MVEGGDVVAQRSTEFEEKSEQEVFDKPESSDGAIVEDSRTLHLHKAGGVVEVNSDCSRNTVKPVERVENAGIATAL